MLKAVPGKICLSASQSIAQTRQTERQTDEGLIQPPQTVFTDTAAGRRQF